MSAFKELVERWRREAESHARKAKDIDYSGGDSSAERSKETLCDKHADELERALPAIEADIRREVEEELRKPGSNCKNPLSKEQLDFIRHGVKQDYPPTFDEVLQLLDMVESLTAICTEQSEAVKLAEEVALRAAAMEVEPDPEHHSELIPSAATAKRILALTKSGPLLAAHDAKLRERQHRATLRAAVRVADCSEIIDSDIIADMVKRIPMPPLADDEKGEVADVS